MSKAQGKFDFSVHHPFKYVVLKRILFFLSLFLPPDLDSFLTLTLNSLVFTWSQPVLVLDSTKEDLTTALMKHLKRFQY